MGTPTGLLSTGAVALHHVRHPGFADGPARRSCRSSSDEDGPAVSRAAARSHSPAKRIRWPVGVAKLLLFLNYDRQTYRLLIFEIRMKDGHVFSGLRRFGTGDFVQMI